MKKLLLIILITTLFNVKASAQSYINNWLGQQGTGGFIVNSNMCSDNAGNIYKVGNFSLSPDFDPGVGVNNITSNGSSDIFIQKLDASGNLLWVKTIGGTGTDSGRDIAVDVLGNVYITGDFYDTVDFDPSNSSVTKISEGWEDAFVLKLNSVGDYQWVKTAGGTGVDLGYSIGLDNSANVYVTGTYEASASFDALAAGSNLTSNGQYDAYVWKLSATGSFTWVKTIGGTGYDYGYEIDVDGVGNSYIGGKAQSGADFDPGTSVYSGINNGGYDAYVVSLDVLGDFQWANTFGGSGEDKVLEITLSTTNGIYISGSFNSTVNFDPTGAGLSISALSSNELFIQNIDVSGNFSWAKAFAGCLPFSNSYIKEASNTNVIFCGGFSGTADFDPNAGTQLVTSAGNVDVFFEEIDASGNYIDVFTMGGSSGDKGFSLLLDNTDAVIITGSASSNFDFNPNGTVLTPGFKPDYIAKYILCSISEGTDVQMACNTYDWIDGNTYTSSNSTATHTLINAAGCDSIVTLDLTISYPVAGTDVQTSCNSFDWIDGSTYITSNNTATHTLMSAAGCDSVVTLDLTINTVDTGVSQSGNVLMSSASGATYQWLDCDNGNAIISGETNQVFTASNNGNYAVEVTQNSCVDTSACFTVIGVGVSENNWKSNLNLYPNPTNGQFSIDLGENFSETNIQIFDLGGRVVYQKIIENKRLVSLDLKAQKGIYFVRISTEKKQSTFKLIKQ
jgi:type IX secretion system substrate protein/beta-propeller repeat-containing protein